MRKMVDGEEYSVPSTIDDIAIIAELEETLAAAGILR